MSVYKVVTLETKENEPFLSLHLTVFIHDLLCVFALKALEITIVKYHFHPL